MATDLGGPAGWVLGVLETMGYAGIALLVALETFVPPIPSEIVLPAAGFLVGRGRLSFAGVLAAATLGSLAGSVALYALARRVGAARVEAWVARRGRWVGVEPRDLDRAQAWFLRRGAWAVLLGRLAPAVRSLVSLPAGLARMPPGRFILLTAAGSLLWNALLVGVGWQLGARWDAVGPSYEKVEWLVWTLLLGAFGWHLARRAAKRRRERGAGSGPA